MFRLNRYGKVAVVTLVMVLLGSVSAFAEYNQEHVVRVMRDNVALMGEIREAAAAEDWI
jgi:hypothetical protein